MRAVVIDRFGDPAEVLRAAEVPTPEPGPGQVRVRMIASPVNPSDLMMIAGQYGIRPPLPATPGFEGVGVVEKSGGGILGWLRTGRRVAVINSGGGNWAEYAVVSARHIVPVPTDLPDEQAATFFVNPATALVMTRRVLAIRRGEWLLQSAAGGALGRMLIRLAKLDGYRTINIVRRREQVAELEGIGADIVLCEADGPVEPRVRELTGGAGVRCAVDPVGGETGSAVIRCLAPHGTALLFGLLSGKPVEVDPRFLISGCRRVEGFWLADWAKRQRALTMLGLFRQVNRLLRSGVLATESGASFPLEAAAEAVRRAAEPGRSGKVVLRIESPRG